MSTPVLDIQTVLDIQNLNVRFATPDGEVAKFIERRGEGVMLISFNVDSTRRSMDELKQKGYSFIGGPRPFRDCEFAFIHPRTVNGVLLELIDYKWPEHQAQGG